MIRAGVQIGVVLAVLGGVYWYGDRTGSARAEAKHNAALLAQIEAGEVLSKALHRVTQQRAEYALKLKEQAYADPVAVPHCLGPNRVRRLNALR